MSYLLWLDIQRIKRECVLHKDMMLHAFYTDFFRMNVRKLDQILWHDVLWLTQRHPNSGSNFFLPLKGYKIKIKIKFYLSVLLPHAVIWLLKVEIAANCVSGYSACLPVQRVWPAGQAPQEASPHLQSSGQRQRGWFQPVLAGRGREEPSALPAEAKTGTPTLWAT